MSTTPTETQALIMRNCTATPAALITSRLYVSNLRERFGCAYCTVFQGAHPISGNVITAFVEGDGSAAVFADHHWEVGALCRSEWEHGAIEEWPREDQPAGTFNPSAACATFAADTFHDGDCLSRRDLLGRGLIKTDDGVRQKAREQVEAYMLTVDGEESIRLNLEPARMEARHLADRGHAVTLRRLRL